MRLFDFWNKPSVCRPTVLLQQLEERIVLDAAITPVDQQNQDNTATNPTDQMDQSGGTSGPDAGLQGSAADAAQSAVQLGNVFNQDLNVVLISNALGDVEAISNAVVPGAHVIVYDAQHDNLSTLTGLLDALVQTTGKKIGDLALVSHGTDGILEIGADHISLLNLGNYRAEFADLGTLLGADSQIQFFGCDVAGPSQGKALVEFVSLYTGATVFASVDTTGGTGHDWDLEYASDAAAASHTLLTAETLAGVGEELGDAVRITDLDTAPLQNIDYTTLYDGKLYFSASNGSEYELYAYDGTTATKIDVYPGDGSNYPQGLMVYDGKLYFGAYSGASGYGIYSYDGSTVTREIATANRPYELAVYGGDFYFQMYADSQTELYTYDGTAVMKVTAADVNPGGSSDPQYLTVYDGRLYYSAFDGSEYELYAYDGAFASKVDAADLRPGDSTYPRYLTSFDGNLYFYGNSSSGNHLWAYDGATDSVSQVAGTSNVVDVTTNAAGDLLVYDGWGPSGWGLYTYDGTSSSLLFSHTGTHPVAYDVAFLGSVPYFSMYDGAAQTLHLYDGSAIADAPGTSVYSERFSSYPADMAAYDGNLYFSYYDGYERELWVYDGSSVSKVAAADVNAGGSSSPRYMEVFGDKLYFSADNGSTYSALYAYDAVTNTCTLVPSTGNVSDIEYSPHFNMLFYWGAGPLGYGMHRYDGSTDTLISPSAYGDYATEYHDKLYFGAYVNEGTQWGYELYVYDGTAVTKVANADMTPTGFTYPSDMTVYNDLLYFLGSDGSASHVYAFDDVAQTTTVVPGISYAYDMESDGSLLYLSIPGTGLYAYDGTNLYLAAGANTSAEGSIYYHDYLAVAGGTFYFEAYNDTVGYEMYQWEPNTAPVLDTTEAPTLGPIDEDPVSNPGTLVSAIVGDSISDPDPGALEGIAVIGVDNAHGTWWFTTNGTTWQAFGTPSPTGAVLLASDAGTAIRFVPDADWHGDAQITYRAWDQCTGTNGQTGVDVSINGEITAFSTEVETATITVNAVNDAPVLNGNGIFTTVTEEQTGNTGNTVHQILNGQFFDTDGNPEGIAITGTTIPDLRGSWQYRLWDEGASRYGSWTNVGTIPAGSALLLDAMDQVRYRPDAEYGGTASITYHAWDQSDGITPGTKAPVTLDPWNPAGAYSDDSGTAQITVTNVPENPGHLVEFGGKLFLSYDRNDAAGRELYSYDPSLPFDPANFVLAADVNTRRDGDGSGPQYLTVWDRGDGEALYFQAESWNGTSYEVELWRYDGVGPATKIDLRAGNSGSNVQHLAVLDGDLFVSANRAADDGNVGQELYRLHWDGAAYAITRVANIHPTGSSNPNDLTAYNGDLYFGADDGSSDGSYPRGRELYRYDPDTGLVSLVADIRANTSVNATNNSGMPPNTSDSPGYMGVFDGTYNGITDEWLVFQARDNTNGYELWIYNPDYNGGVPEMAAEFRTGTGNGNPTSIMQFNDGPALYLGAYLQAAGGQELGFYRPDIDTFGVAQDLRATGGSSPEFMTELAGSIYFVADDGTGSGIQVHRYTNQPPTAGDFGVTGDEGSVIAVPRDSLDSDLTNDNGWDFTDAEGNAGWLIQLTAGPAHGKLWIDDGNNVYGDPADVLVADTGGIYQTISWNQGDSVRYQADDINYNGTDTVTYVLQDDMGAEGDPVVAATATITVTPVNDPPLVTLPFEDVAVDEDATPLTIDLLGHFSDIETTAANLVYTVTVVNTDGVISSATVNNASDQLTLSFVGNVNGVAQVTVTATDTGDGTDATLHSVSDTFQVTVNPINDPPAVILPFADVAVDEDAGPVTIDLLGHFSDIETTAANLVYTVTVINTDGVINTATVNNASDQLTLSFVGNVNGVAQVTVTATDTGDGTDTTPHFVSDTFQVTVNPINDPPVVILPFADVAVDEDAGPVTIDLLGHFSDIETTAANLVYTVTVVNTDGVINTATVDNASDQLTLSFVGNANGVAQVTVTATDTGDGTDTTPHFVSDTFQVTVNPINDPPVVILPFADVAVDEDASAVTIDLLGHFSDIETAGSDLVYTVSVVNTDGVINTATVDNASDQLTLSFVGNANGVAQVTVTATDTGDGTDTTPHFVSDTFQVTVNPINDPPLVTLPFDDVAVDEDATPLTIDLLGHFSDLETTAANLVYTVTVVNTDGVINTATVNNASDQLTLSFVGNANGVAQVTVTATDTGDGTDATLHSVSDTFQVTVNPINDRPVNTLPASSPGSRIHVTEDVQYLFGTNAVQVNDVDIAGGEGNGTIRVTLTATNGTLALTGTTAGLTGDLDGSDRTLSFSGALNDVNNALDGLAFRGNLNYSGNASIVITTSDLGNNPAPALQDSDTIYLTVGSVNDAPVITYPAATQSVVGNTYLNFGTSISVSDIDARNGLLQVTLGVQHGTLNLVTKTGLTFLGGSDGIWDSTMTFRGTLTNLNNALHSLQYRTVWGYSGADSLSISVNDQGNTGTGGAKTDTDSVGINVLAPTYWGRQRW